MATVELRDGRKIVGQIGSYTVQSKDNRELVLWAPMKVKPDPERPEVRIDDGRLVLREQDILYLFVQHASTRGETGNVS